MLDWRIYYADYSTFDSSQGLPWKAPGTRVVLIVDRHEDPRERPRLQLGDDYYVWKDDHWYCVDKRACDQYWFHDQMHLDHPRASLTGETVSNKVWNDINQIALSDPDFFGE